MENKKSIKINLSTLFIIILIIIIAVLSFFVCKLVKENKNIKNELDAASNESVSNLIDENIDKEEEENSDEEEKEDITEGVKLSQLEGEFYKIEEIIKEEREIVNVKNYKDFEFDLDNDGEVDKITLRHIVNKDEEETSVDRDYYTLEYNGKTVYERWYGMGNVGIVDLDDTDENLEVWVYDEGPSDDPCYIFYRKDGNEMIKLGGFDVDRAFYTDGKGTVLAADRFMPWVEPTVFDAYYTIKNNKFAKNELDFSYNKDFEYTSTEGFFTTDLENLEKLKNDDSEYEDLIIKGEKYNINKLDENTKFKILDFVEKTKEYDAQSLKIELLDGTQGYLIHPYGVFYIYD